MTFSARDTAYWSDEHPTEGVGWSDAPSPHLVSQLSDVSPGRALDVGCGDGADARWLARHGWQVEAADVSQVALRRAAGRVQEATPDLAPAIRWRHADLVAEPPQADGYDLVTCQDVTVPAADRERFVRGLAAAVRRAGTFLLVTRDPGDADAGTPRSAAEQAHGAAEAAELLDDGPWLVDVCASWPRTATGADGRPTMLHDGVLRATRL